MLKDMVFFADESTEGIKLTSTSANHVANLAKEYIQEVETRLNNISFFSVDLALIGKTGDEEKSTLQVGDNLETLKSLQSMLGTVMQAKSLIAWLREGIKAKTALMNNLQAISIEGWCKENNIICPEHPKCEPKLTEAEYYDSLPIKERNRYYQLETEAAVIGSYIHPRGVFSNARRELKDKMQHPHQANGTGRDTLIYTYKPTVSTEDVDNVFFELQKRHREIQAQLNSMKHSCEQAINESLNKVNAEYINALQKYRVESDNIAAAFKEWKDKKLQEYNKLKIVVPNALLGIYSIVNSLGK